MADTQPEKPTPPPIKLGRVDSLRGARRAVRRVLNAILSGELEVKQGNAVVYGLSVMGRLLEVEVIEKRLDAIEGQLAAPALPRPGMKLLGRTLDG